MWDVLVETSQVCRHLYHMRVCVPHLGIPGPLRVSLETISICTDDAAQKVESEVVTPYVS
jgi:hypothetical protein